jgi:hypothetical protein
MVPGGYVPSKKRNILLNVYFIFCQAREPENNFRKIFYTFFTFTLFRGWFLSPLVGVATSLLIT